MNTALPVLSHKKQEKNSFTTSNTWSCSYLIHWDGVKDTVKSSKLQAKKRWTKKTLCLPYITTIWHDVCRSHRNLATLADHDGIALVLVEKIDWFFVDPMRNLPKKDGAWRACLICKKNGFLFNIHWCSRKICFPQLSTKIVWEKSLVYWYPDRVHVDIHTPYYVFTVTHNCILWSDRPTLLWWPVPWWPEVAKLLVFFKALKW